MAELPWLASVELSSDISTMGSPPTGRGIPMVVWTSIMHTYVTEMCWMSDAAMQQSGNN